MNQVKPETETVQEARPNDFGYMGLMWVIRILTLISAVVLILIGLGLLLANLIGPGFFSEFELNIKYEGYETDLNNYILLIIIMIGFVFLLTSWVAKLVINRNRYIAFLENSEKSFR